VVTNDQQVCSSMLPDPSGTSSIDRTTTGLTITSAVIMRRSIALVLVITALVLGMEAPTMDAAHTMGLGVVAMAEDLTNLIAIAQVIPSHIPKCKVVWILE